MTIELSNVLKHSSLGQTFKGVNKFFLNKFYSALALTIAIILIIMVLYPCKKETPIYLLLKVGLYIFIGSVSIIFIHDIALIDNYKTHINKQDTEKIIDVISGHENTGFHNETIEIKPNNIKHGGNRNNINIKDGGNDDIFEQYGL